MEQKFDLILSELTKMNSRFDDLEMKVDGLVRAFYQFKNSTERNFKDQFEFNRYVGEFFQGHENRIAALESSA